MVPKLILPLTLVRYIFEVVLIFRDIHQCYLAMAPSGYYKFQVVHFDLIPVEAFLADSKMKSRDLDLFSNFYLLAARVRHRRWNASVHW